MAESGANSQSRRSLYTPRRLKLQASLWAERGSLRLRYVVGPLTLVESTCALALCHRVGHLQQGVRQSDGGHRLDGGIGATVAAYERAIDVMD